MLLELADEHERVVVVDEYKRGLKMTLQEVTKLPDGTKVKDYTGREWLLHEGWPRAGHSGGLLSVWEPAQLDGWTEVRDIFSREEAVRHTLAHGSTWCRADIKNPVPVGWDAVRCLFVVVAGPGDHASHAMLNPAFTKWYMVDPGTDT